MSNVSAYKSLLDPNRGGQVFELADKPAAQAQESTSTRSTPKDQYQHPADTTTSRFQDILNGVKSNQSQ